MVMQHMSTHLMLYEATNMMYNPLDNRLLIFVFASCGVIWIFAHHLNIYNCVVGLNVIVIYSALHYIVNLIWELTNVLNIHCFKVKQNNQESLLTTI